MSIVIVDGLDRMCTRYYISFYTKHFNGTSGMSILP